MLTDPRGTEGIDEENQSPEGMGCPSESEDSFPDFEFQNVTPSECRKLDLSECSVSVSSKNCANATSILVKCTASPSSLSVVSSRISKLRSQRPVRFVLLDHQTFPEVFVPIRLNVIALQVSYMESAYVTKKIPGLRIPNLIYLMVSHREMAIVGSQDFASNCKLRMIRFWMVTFDSIETGTFSNLPELRHISFEES